MDTQKTRQFVEATWENSIIPSLTEYLAIPNQSPAYDPDWQTNGYLDQAVDLIAGWIRRQTIPGLSLEVVRLAGRTPLLFIEVPGASSETVLLYGHLDKQPPMDGWHDGLGPWQPVLRDGKLYGRGGADDGYAAFASLTAIAALKRQGVPVARCVIIIEACEESGSGDLPYYMDALAERIGTPSLVVCLDSGCGNYDQLWVTTSLRGLVSGNLSVSSSHRRGSLGCGQRYRAFELSDSAPNPEPSRRRADRRNPVACISGCNTGRTSCVRPGQPRPCWGRASRRNFRFSPEPRR